MTRKPVIQTQIYNTLDEIFEWAHSDDFEAMGKQEFANMVGMSYSCLYALRTRRTRDPRYSTILKLFRAVGLNHLIDGVELTEKKVKKVRRQKSRRYATTMQSIVKFPRKHA
jgi:hypothetical protein